MSLKIKKFIQLMAVILLIAGSVDFEMGQLPTVSAGTEYHYHFPIFAYEDPDYAVFASIGPDGGTVSSVAIDPGDSNTLYAGTWGNGIYKSVDGGDNWVEKNIGLQSGFIFDIAIDPSNSAHLLITIYRFGIYESLNGGETWAPTSGLPAGTVVYSIVFDPNNTRLVYAGVRLKTIYTPETRFPGGVYKSTNGGSTWVDKSNGLPDDYVYDIAIDPNDSDVLFVALHRTGVYRSGDRAHSWHSVNYDIPYQDVRSVDFNPQTSDLYAGLYDGEGVVYLKKGTQTWRRITSTFNQDLSVYHLKVDPSNPKTLFLTTTSGLYRCIGDPSPDQATICKRIGDHNTLVFDLALDLNSADSSGMTTRMFSALENFGLYKSSDAGDSFSPSYQGIKANNIVSVLNDPSQPAVLYASAYQRGVFKSVDEGGTWTPLTNGLPSKLINQLVFKPGDSYVIYAATQDKGLYRSPDQGLSWQPINEGLPSFKARTDGLIDGGSEPGWEELRKAYGWMDPVDLETMQVSFREPDLDNRAESYRPIFSLAIDPSKPWKMVLGTDRGTWKSNNDGATWFGTEMQSGGVYDLMVDPSKPESMYIAGLSKDGIKVSDSDRSAWSMMNNGLPTVVDVFGLTHAPSGSYFAASSNGIYKTNLARNAWSSVGLAGSRFNDIYASQDELGVVWAVSSDGLYRSGDHGSQWFHMGRENLNNQFQTVAQGFGSTPVYFGTNGGNIYYLIP